MNYLIIFIVVIVVLQLIIYAKTAGLIKKLKLVLKGDFETQVQLDGDNPITTIYYDENEEISNTIEESINGYLLKNRGAVSDFNLIKDIVERNCDSLEAEIEAQTPLPLYLGLMGTVAGIILGLVTIEVNGGFSNIENVIEKLMTDVAVAMIASFLGILMTTISLWKSKKCKAIIESNKNRFYTWIQTNLLPVISRSAVSAITLLQHNLTHFNNSFAGTAERLEKSLGNVGDVYDSQLELLREIREIDVNQMASANVKILKTLKDSVYNLEAFAQYMSEVTEYLTAVRDLNGKIDDHLERTEALAIVADFYKKHMREIEVRQSAISEVVVQIDAVMGKALAELSQNSAANIKALQEAYVSQMEEVQHAAAVQTERLNQALRQMPQFFDSVKDIAAIPAKLDKVAERIGKSNDDLAKKLDRILAGAGNRAGSTGTGSPVASVGGSSMPEWLKWTLVASVVVIAIACVFNVVLNITSKPKETATAVVEQTYVSPNNKEVTEEVVEELLAPTETPSEDLEATAPEEAVSEANQP